MAHTHTRELTEEHVFCLEGCRSYKQYYKMRQGFETGACAFCQVDREFNKIIWEDEFAMLWKVPDEYLRPELALHALIVPKYHRRFETDLAMGEVHSIHMAKTIVRKELGYTGGMSHVREGDMRLNAGTVPHLHYNIFQPNETGEVRIPVFKGLSGRAENKDRAFGFSQRFVRGEIPE